MTDFMRIASTAFMLITCLLCAGQTSAESRFHADLTAGGGFISESGYDPGTALDHSIAYTNSGFSYRFGLLGILDLKTKNGLNKAQLDVRSAYLGIAKEIDLELLQLELGGGIVASETELTLLQREIANEKDQSPFINAKLTKSINNFFALQLDWKYIHDLSGADFNLIQAGVRFSFP